MAERIQLRRDTKARWASVNPILLQGEVGYVTDDPNLCKLGDGVNTWNNLPWRGFGGTIVQSVGTAENAVMSQKATTDAIVNSKTELQSEIAALDVPGLRGDLDDHKVEVEETFEDVYEKIGELEEQSASAVSEVNEARDNSIEEINSTSETLMNEFNQQRITPIMLSPETLALMEVGGSGGTITNFPDGEDLTSEEVNDIPVLKIADRSYSSSSQKGKGYKILRMNIVSNVNKLVQADINDANTIYEVRYDFDLGGGTIDIPSNVTLDFNGGSFKNGTISGDFTVKRCESGSLNVSIDGVVNGGEVEADWFIGSTSNIASVISNLLVENDVKLSSKTYTITQPIVLQSFRKLKGSGIDKTYIIADSCNGFTLTEKIWVVLKDFTLNQADDSQENIGINIVTRASFCKFEDIIINYFDEAIHGEGTVWECKFSQLRINYCNTGISIEGTGGSIVNRFYNCHFNENSDAMVLSALQSCLIDRCNFGGLKTETSRAVVFLQNSVATMLSCNIETYSLNQYEGAVQIASASVITLIGCLFYDVRTGTSADNGSVTCKDTSKTIIQSCYFNTDTDIMNNLFVMNSSDVQILNTEISKYKNLTTGSIVFFDSVLENVKENTIFREKLEANRKVLSINTNADSFIRLAKKSDVFNVSGNISTSGSSSFATIGKNVDFSIIKSSNNYYYKLSEYGLERFYELGEMTVDSIVYVTLRIKNSGTYSGGSVIITINEGDVEAVGLLSGSASDFTDKSNDVNVYANYKTSNFIGTMIFDKSSQKPAWWDGTKWVDATGTEI